MRWVSNTDILRLLHVHAKFCAFLSRFFQSRTPQASPQHDWRIWTGDGRYETEEHGEIQWYLQGQERHQVLQCHVKVPTVHVSNTPHFLVRTVVQLDGDKQVMMP